MMTAACCFLRFTRRRQLFAVAPDHYAAKLAGLYPEDPLQAALADQAYFFCEDVLQVRRQLLC
jgi:hypothetical protein